MAAVTICSDFGAQKNKVSHCLHCFPIYLPWSRVQLFVTAWTATRQAPLSMGFSRQGYWSGLVFPSPGDLPNPGIEPGFPALQVDSLPSEPTGKPSLPLGLYHLPSGKKGLPCPAYHFTPALLVNFMSPSNMLVIFLFFFFFWTACLLHWEVSSQGQRFSFNLFVTVSSLQGTVPGAWWVLSNDLWVNECWIRWLQKSHMPLI